jgi:oxygen-independent coproporphyrinogen-3 oxidase
VNRISLGVQALDDAALRLLGREHDRAEATRAIALAQRVAPRTTFDLIYARPGQTLAAWRAELDEALAIAEGHLSLYQLTIEKGTPFHALQRAGSLALPPEDQAAAFFEVTQHATERAGLAAYEISNHAAPGQQCRHNLSYWRYEDYLGVGPGAHGRLSVARPGGKPALMAIRNHAKPETWLEAVQRDSHGNAETHALARGERVEEMLMMGLRLGEGVSLARFRARTGLSLERAVPPARLARLLEAGFLKMSEGALRTTPKGRVVLNTLLAELLT